MKLPNEGHACIYYCYPVTLRPPGGLHENMPKGVQLFARDCELAAIYLWGYSSELLHQDVRPIAPF